MQETLAKIQREKLAEVVLEEARKKGVEISPITLHQIVEKYYLDYARVPGKPLTSPTLQEERSRFDVGNYNEFIESIKTDLDTVLSLSKRSRISARNLLLSNDVHTRRYYDRLSKVSRDMDNFNREAPKEKDSVKTKVFEVGINSTEFVTLDPTRALDVDGKYEVLQLDKETDKCKTVSLKFLKDSTEAVSYQFGTSPELIADRQEESPFSNVSNTDASPWIYRMKLKSKDVVSESRIVVTIELPYIEAINNIEIAPVYGMEQSIEVLSSEGDQNYTSLGKREFNKAESFNLNKVSKVKVVRLVIDSRTVKEVSGLWEVVFGVTSLKLNNNIYKSEGDVIFKDIEPNVNGRPILNVGLKVSGTFPQGTYPEYAIDINGSSDIEPENPINGSPNDSSKVNFSIADTIEADNTNITRSTFKSLNAVNFDALKFDDLNKFEVNQNKTYIPEIAELWVGQNTWKVSEPPEFREIEIKDAQVDFLEDMERTKVKVTLDEYGLALRSDSKGEYLLMPMEVVTISNVKVYETKNPQSPEDISARVTETDGKKIYLSGSYTSNDSFSVTFTGLLDESITAKRGSLRLHIDSGEDGSREDNTINLSDGLYQFSFEDNTIFSTPESTLSNTTKYLDFTALIPSSRLLVYEAYAYCDEATEFIELDRTMQVDRHAGEYIALTHLDSGKTVHIEDKSAIEDVSKGWYLITVQSKPYTSHPSAIDQMLKVKDMAGFEVQDKVFSSSSKYFSKFGVSKEPLKYSKYTHFINKTPQFSDDTFSFIRKNGEIVFLVPEFSSNRLEVDGSDSESANLKLRYYPTDLFAGGGFSSMKLKISLKSQSSSDFLNYTASIRKIELEAQYI